MKLCSQLVALEASTLQTVREAQERPALCRPHSVAVCRLCSSYQKHQSRRSKGGPRSAFSAARCPPVLCRPRRFVLNAMQCFGVWCVSGQMPVTVLVRAHLPFLIWTRQTPRKGIGSRSGVRIGPLRIPETVSYTHLTLPTICSV